MVWSSYKDDKLQGRTTRGEVYGHWIYVWPVEKGQLPISHSTVTIVGQFLLRLQPHLVVNAG
jgi:hypothetical protein